MTGILAKALGGAGQAGAALSIEQFKKDALADRDARLNEFALKLQNNAAESEVSGKMRLADYGEQLRRDRFKPVGEAMDAASKPTEETYASEEGDYKTSRKPSKQEILLAGYSKAMSLGDLDAAKSLHELMKPTYQAVPKDGILIDETGKTVAQGPGPSPEERAYYTAHATAVKDNARANLITANSLSARRSAADKEDHKIDESDKLIFTGMQSRMKGIEAEIGKREEKAAGLMDPKAQESERSAINLRRKQLNGIEDRYWGLMEERGYIADRWPIQGLPNPLNAANDLLNKDPTREDLDESRKQFKQIYGDHAKDAIDMLDQYEMKVLGKSTKPLEQPKGKGKLKAGDRVSGVRSFSQ